MTFRSNFVLRTNSNRLDHCDGCDYCNQILEKEDQLRCCIVCNKCWLCETHMEIGCKRDQGDCCYKHIYLFLYMCNTDITYLISSIDIEIKN